MKIICLFHLFTFPSIRLSHMNCAIPIYCWVSIFGYLDASSIRNTRITCKFFHSIIEETLTLRGKKYGRPHKAFEANDNDVIMLAIKSHFYCASQRRDGTITKCISDFTLLCIHYDNDVIFKYINGILKKDPYESMQHRLAIEIGKRSAVKVLQAYANLCKYPIEFIISFGCLIVKHSPNKKNQMAAELVKILHWNRNDEVIEDLTDYAATSNNFELFNYLIISGQYNENNKVNFPSAQFLKCLIDNGKPLNRKVAHYAIAENNIDNVIFLFNAGKLSPLNTDSLCTHAAKYNALDCLVYLRNIGLPWSERTYNVAVARGSTHCIEFLEDNGCPH